MRGIKFIILRGRKKRKFSSLWASKCTVTFFWQRQAETKQNNGEEGDNVMGTEMVGAVCGRARALRVWCEFCASAAKSRRNFDTAARGVKDDGISVCILISNVALIVFCVLLLVVLCVLL